MCQICDNKKNLNKVFELNKEIVGFDDLLECSEAITYYSEHIDEAIQIGLNARDRFLKDYTVEKIWQKLENEILMKLQER